MYNKLELKGVYSFIYKFSELLAVNKAFAIWRVIPKPYNKFQRIV